MGYHDRLADTALTLIRPRLLIETARIGARLYRRERDLPAAIPGFTGASPMTIVARLEEAERYCEQQRQARSPSYRPAIHVQVLSALLAEAARSAQSKAGQAKASGSDSLRLAM